MVKIESSPSTDFSIECCSIDAVKVEANGSKHQELLALLRKHAQSFPSELPKSLPPLRSVNHDIDIVGCDSPPSRPPIRLSQPELDELQRQLEDLLRRGFIEPSKSPFGAPVFFVKKADGTLRLVCDWRQLNKVTIKTQACLPSVDDLFDTVQGSRYFSRLDLMSGYNQVRVNPPDIPKTAINTAFGHFQFTVMGFGLTNAPATFTALMNHILRPFLRRSVVVFLDDILIFSRSWQDHLKHLDEVLSALEQEKMFCKPSKCLFAASKVKFLGHVVSGECLEADPDKLSVVQTWPCPESVSDVRKFLGFANFFRRFIERFAAISRPLEELTGKYAQFCWTPACQRAFDCLRQALVSAPVLRLPDTNKLFRHLT